MEKYTEVWKYVNIIQYDVFVIVLLTAIISLGVGFCYWMYSINRFKEILYILITVVALISYLATVKLRIVEDK